MGLQREKAEYETIDAVIVRTLADATGQDPTDVDFRLYDHLNPDALERLYEDANARDGAGWRFEFAAEGFEVTVQSDGRVSVT
ncbi:MAG: HalOD1 output domain-containing protein [Haloferacaceae archaeon]